MNRLLRAAKPRLMAVSLNGADLAGKTDTDWQRLIQPLDQGDFDVPDLAARTQATRLRRPDRPDVLRHSGRRGNAFDAFDGPLARNPQRIGLNGHRCTRAEFRGPGRECRGQGRQTLGGVWGSGPQSLARLATKNASQRCPRGASVESPAHQRTGALPRPKGPASGWTFD